MSKKRKLDATISADMTPEDAPRAGMGGMWGGAALNMLQARLRETQDSVVASIMAGITALEIPVERIDDPLGSDRVGDWVEDDAFAALMADMERRGQTQPIRVRSADPDWQPEPGPPHLGDGRFVLQSGRRRLEAARRLNRPVRAVLATSSGDATMADMEERFLENTLRQNLSGFEELLSIGLIAQGHADLSQAEIATRLQVPAPDVSLGLSCVELHDRIVATTDVATTPKRAFRQIIPRLRQGAKATSKRPRTTIARKSGKVQVEVSPTRDGFTMKARGWDGGWLELEALAKALARAIAESKRP